MSYILQYVHTFAIEQSPIWSKLTSLTYPQWEERATSLPGLLSFQDSVNAIKRQIKEFFADQARGRKLIAGVGAAAKGNTLINFLGLGVDDIRFVFDSAKSKQGKFLPGSHIP